MSTLEARQSAEKARGRAEEARPKSPAEALLALKEGRGATGLESLDASALSPEEQQDVVQTLVQQERCSEAFAQKLLADKQFRRRVAEICRNMAEAGEKMLLLEEAEVFTEIMEPGCDSVAPLLESTNPQSRFKGLERLDSQGLHRKRLDDMRKELKYVVDPQQSAQVENILKSAFSSVGLEYGGKEEDWKALLSDPEKIAAFSAIPEVKTMYGLVTQGKDLDRAGRRIQMFWTENEEGERIPTMEVRQMAINQENGYVSELGFKIQRKPPREGETEPRRVLSDITVIIDKDVRSKNAGVEFLMGNLSLVREYKLEEAEFIANINIGSYAWARIADMDVHDMAKKLTPGAIMALGPKPWDEKKVKGQVFREQILPRFEGKMAQAVYGILMTIQDPKQKAEMQRVLVDELVGKQYPILQQKALAGELTMEELVNFGRGLDIFKFNEEGEMVAPDDPVATNSGHLGKACIMGIQWKATIPLDTRSMFGIVDRLNKGTGLMSLLKKTGQKIGIALSI